MVYYQTKHLISHQTKVPVAIVIIWAVIFIIQRKGHVQAGDLVWNGRLSGCSGDSSRNTSAAVVCSFHWQGKSIQSNHNVTSLTDTAAFLGWNKETTVPPFQPLTAVQGPGSHFSPSSYRRLKWFCLVKRKTNPKPQKKISNSFPLLD